MKKLNHFSIKKMLLTTGIRMYASTLMKKTLLLVLAAVLFSNCKKNVEQESGSSTNNLKGGKAGTSVTPGHYTVATYNIRRITTADTGNRTWTTRRPLVKDMILKYAFDIFGVQEPLGSQIDNMVTDLAPYGYARFGVSDHNDHAYQHQDIFYKTAKFTLLGSGKFWMAPGGPTSVPSDTTPWDSYYHACVCTWGRFLDKATGQIFFVFNTHFDPGAPGGGVGAAPIAKQESANLMLSKINSIAGLAPAIFMGDLNTDQNYPPYATLHGSQLLDETWEIAGTVVPAAYRQTGNWWNPYPYGQSQIDHIFVTNQWSVAKRAVLWDNYDGINGSNDVLPSDHFPVVADIKLPDPVTTTLTPTDDAYVRDGSYGNNNYGADPGFTIKSGSLNYSRKAFMKFDVSSIPSTVTSAKLRVYGSNIESTANVDIKSYYAATDNWTEDLITWNNCPVAYSLGATAVNSTLKYYEWDVTSYVQGQVAGDDIVSLVLHQIAGGNLTTTWHSKEGVNKPELVIIH